ncbi:LURP-one-related/scramblase family protein, partial [Streptomyces sp. NPDC127020]|uniref:LURP-one-related/scramblase family protein n=1 Tax=Streptomyces sp. NPDC127020 TaxID=3347109 RepID=UPI00365E1211
MRFLVYDRLLGIGDDYWIEDDTGSKVYLVDGKAMRLRDTWELKDAQGRVLIDIHQKMLALRDTMVIERAGEPLARIKRKRLSLLRNHYRVALADGTELDVSGKILDRELGGGVAGGHPGRKNPPGGTHPGTKRVGGRTGAAGPARRVARN